MRFTGSWGSGMGGTGRRVAFGARVQARVSPDSLHVSHAGGRAVSKDAPDCGRQPGCLGSPRPHPPSLPAPLACAHPSPFFATLGIPRKVSPEKNVSAFLTGNGELLSFEWERDVIRDVFEEEKK